VKNKQKTEIQLSMNEAIPRPEWFCSISLTSCCQLVLCVQV
jgi:hypothetical protein